MNCRRQECILRRNGIFFCRVQKQNQRLDASGKRNPEQAADIKLSGSQNRYRENRYEDIAQSGEPCRMGVGLVRAERPEDSYQRNTGYGERDSKRRYGRNGRYADRDEEQRCCTTSDEAVSERKDDRNPYGGKQFFHGTVPFFRLKME